MGARPANPRQCRLEIGEHGWYHTLSALVHALESKDPSGPGHSQRVAASAVRLGQAAGLPDDDLQALWLGAFLHDIGKVAVSDLILHKPGRLTAAERQAVQIHPVVGARILRPLFQAEDPRILDVVLYHHERLDGSGYPCGLSGQSIPLWARICCVADAWDAMTSPRPYRTPLSVEQASAELA